MSRLPRLQSHPQWIQLSPECLISIPPFPRRYEHALSKANYASLALRPGAGGGEEEEGAGLEEDEDLYQSLNK